MKKINEELIAFLKESPTAFHAIHTIRTILEKKGYMELNESDAWDIQENGKYFVVRNESSILAFRIPSYDFNGFNIAASHSDSPSFKVKENPEIVENGYVKLNVEKYGGSIYAPWFDRPLSVAGRLLIKKKDGIETRLVNVDKDFLVIPNLAIHMSRENTNKDRTWDVQKEMLPIMGSVETKGTFMSIVAKAAGVKEKDILGHDLFLYLREEGRIWGADDEYISAGHLDDLQCGFGNLKGFLASKNGNSVPVLAIFDNEEVGSTSKQGANSTFLQDTLQRIAIACGRSGEEYSQAVANSFMVSADNAHAVHPNHAEKADPINRPEINKGIVIKFSANQKYTTDGVSAALFRNICEKANVPTQVFTNHSNILGGGTLGNYSNIHVSLNTVDIGLPQLAMHSCYETAGTKDTQYLSEAMKVFFSSTFVSEGKGNYHWE